MNAIHRPNRQELNLVWALLLAVLISGVLVGISFIVFLNNGAYVTVKQISAAEDVLQTKSEDIDTSSPIQASDIHEYAQNLPQRVRAFNEEEDFGTLSL